MSEMIERIAKAIYEKRNGAGCHPWRYRTSTHKAPYLTDASAALEAMREPGLSIRKITTFEFAEVEWPKLIDAALQPATDSEASK